MGKRARKPGAPDAGRNYLREWHAAIELEREARQEGFTRELYPLGPFLIRPLNLRDLDALLIARSSVLSDGEFTREDIAGLVCLLCPEYAGKEGDDLAPMFDALVAADLDTLLGDAEHFIDLMFVDAPGGGGGSAPIAHFAATYVDLICSSYGGFTEAAVMALPLPRLYSYVRLIQRRADPKAPTFNRLSDAASANYLAALNAQPPKKRAAWEQAQQEGLQHD